MIILVNIWIGVPFNFLILQSGLQALPEDVHEAAAVDGAGWWRELFSITVPMLRESMFAVVMLGIHRHPEGVRLRLDHDRRRPGQRHHAAGAAGLPAGVRRVRLRRRRRGDRADGAGDVGVVDHLRPGHDTADTPCSPHRRTVEAEPGSGSRPAAGADATALPTEGQRS